MVSTTEDRFAIPPHPFQVEPTATLIIRTDDPKYFPASGRRVDELKEMISGLREDLLIERDDGYTSGSAALAPVVHESQIRFNRLVQQWREETAFSSSLLEMATHPAYQQIIGMGRVAIPFILRELSRQTDHWFWALKAITAEDTVPSEARGDLAKMAQAWLVWGARNGYDF